MLTSQRPVGQAILSRICEAVAIRKCMFHERVLDLRISERTLYIRSASLRLGGLFRWIRVPPMARDPSSYSS